MLKTTRFFKTINNVYVNCLRLQNTTVTETQSVRQKAWLNARQQYTNYEHVHYSSFLECQLAPIHNVHQRKQKYVYPPLEDLLNEAESSSNAPLHPDNWLDDYEFYEGSKDELGNIDSKYGTADPTVPPSHVPCNGCGAHLHCANTALPGYIPSEIFRGRTNLELKTIICQRCHFLKHYNIALDVEVPPSAYVETISRIQDKFALAIVIVDLLDIPSSIWPGMQHVLGPKRPVFLVGNKVDLLPRDSNSYLTHVKKCLEEQFIQHGGFDALNIKNVSLISAKTGFGIEELITELQKTWKYNGDVYLLGCTNVGKSTLFNILLNSDYCRPEATELVRKATVCPWPGTTLQMLKFPILRPSDHRIYLRFRRLFAERAQRAALDKLRRDQARETGVIASAQLVGYVGRTYDQREELSDAFGMAKGTRCVTTLDERKKDYRQARWVYDTPGVMQPDQFTSLLTTEELLQLETKRMIQPRAYRVRPNMTLMLAGLARIDLLSCCKKNSKLDWIKMFIFASLDLPILITETLHADALYKRYLGTPLLGVPIQGADKTRLQHWPGLQCKDQDIIVSTAKSAEYQEESKLNCDVTLSSAGWLGLMLPQNSECSLRVWTPCAGGIYVRQPALIPLADRLVGKHIRNSLAYNLAKPFVFKK